mgnify:CR=1 FL=1
MDLMGDVNTNEAALVLAMITYVGCDGKEERYMTVHRHLLNLYPVLMDILEAIE